MRFPIEKVQAIADELMMVDQCTITRDVELTADDVWSDTTGTYTPPPGDRVTVYTGACNVYSTGGYSDQTKGGQLYAEERYYLALPTTSTVTLLPKDRIVVTASLNQQMVAMAFRIDSAVNGTFYATRRFRIFNDTRIPL